MEEMPQYMLSAGWEASEKQNIHSNHVFMIQNLSVSLRVLGRDVNSCKYPHISIDIDIHSYTGLQP